MFSYRINRKSFILLLMLVSMSIPANAKYVVLDPAKTITAQLQYADCTYEIRDVFQMNGRVLTIPNHCTLLFRGGRILNCSVVFNNTFLDGDIRIELAKNGTAKGHIVNETICTRWFTGNNVQLFPLLNTLLPDNSHKKYVVDSKEYVVKEPLIIRGVSEVVLDFNGAIIIDETQGESTLLHRPNPMILVRTSYNLEIANLNYRLSDNRYLAKTGTAVIWLGYGQNDWDKDIYNVRIHNITGQGKLVKTVKGGTSANMLISGVGNMHNIVVEDIVYDGDVATLCNFEWGLLPADAKEYKKKGVDYPNYYGIHPYNLTIKNVVGKNAPSSTGYIRLSSCYNSTVENCYGYNVNSLFMLYNGDFSISRVNGSATIRNCASYVNDEYKGSSLSGLLIFNTYSDPVSSKQHSAGIEHNMSYIIENCEFQGRNGLSGCGVRVLGGDGHVVLNNVTVKNYTLGAKLSGAVGMNKVGGLSFYDCLFLNNKSSIEIYSLDGCLLQGCTFKSNYIHSNNEIDNSQVAVYSGVKDFTLRNCTFEEKNAKNKASFVTFEQKENVNAVIDNCIFTGSEVAEPVVVPKSVKLENCRFN